MKIIKLRKVKTPYSQVHDHRHPYTIRRSLFTLVEILIVFCIIICGAALTAVKWRELVQETRFESEVKMLQGQFKLAQDLMLITNADVLLFIKKDKETGGLESRFFLDKPINPRWGKSIQRTLSFPSIKLALWNQQKMEEHLFYFSPTSMPQGELALYPFPRVNDEAKMQFKKIYFSGTIHPLNGLEDKDQNSPSSNNLINLYPVEVEKLNEAKN